MEILREGEKRPLMCSLVKDADVFGKQKRENI